MNTPQANNSGQTFFRWGTTLIALLALSSPAAAQSFSFSTGDPDGRIATASRPASAGKEEIESADDFVLTQETFLRQATFTGLLPAGSGLSDIAAVRVEIYRVFPNDSNVSRTQGHRLLARLTYRRESIPLLMWRLIRVSQALTSLYAFRCEFNLHSE